MRAGGALLARACDVIADAPIVIVYLFSSGILIDLGRAVSSCGRDTNFSRRLALRTRIDWPRIGRGSAGARREREC